VPEHPPIRRPAVSRRALVLVGAGVLAAAAFLLGAVSEAQEKPGAASTAEPPPSPSPSPSRPQPTVTPTTAPVVIFDRGALSTDDPASLWAVVNKARPLTEQGYAPADLVTVPVPHTWPPELRREASAAVVTMFAAFTKSSGLDMQSLSSYRSYDSQVDVYDKGVQARGQTATDLSIARPGTSEHQTGLAIDIGALPADCSLDACFADTEQGSWLAENAWRHGFLLRYPAGKEPVTGYEFEPWHYRYIGPVLAAEMRDRGATTLEEFFDLGAAPAYR
jgi:D-alanyl-D-alanine carboxypeptidase